MVSLTDVTPDEVPGDAAPSASTGADAPAQPQEQEQEQQQQGQAAPAPALAYQEGMPTANLEDEGEDVGQGVRKLVLVPGKEGSSPPALGATVFAHYRAWVRSTGSKVFDTWDEKQQLEINLGNERKNLKGLSAGLRSMQQGEKALLLVPHALAYGEEGNFSFPSVPPRSDLVYEVQLNGFDNPPEGRKTANMTVEDKIESADKRRQAGNEHFKHDRLDEALMEYDMAIGYMGEEFMMQMFGKYRDMANAVRLPCLLNSAACYLKQGKFQEAIGFCSQVLVEDKGNAKALFRRGRAKMALGQMDGAAEDLREAQKLAPGDGAITKALQEIRREEQQQREEQKKMFKGVLDKDKDKDKEKEKAKTRKEEVEEEIRQLLPGADKKKERSAPGLRTPWWKAVWQWLKNCVWHFFDFLGRRKRD